MADRLLRRAEVEQMVGLSRATIYAKMSAGSFPRPKRVGPRIVRWRASDIDAWMAAQPVADVQDWHNARRPHQATEAKAK